MKNKDSAVIKALAELGHVEEQELTPEQEHEYRYATDEDYRYACDIQAVFEAMAVDSITQKELKHFISRYFPPSFIENFKEGHNYRFAVSGDFSKITFKDVDSEHEFGYNLPMKEKTRVVQDLSRAAQRGVLNPLKW